MLDVHQLDRIRHAARLKRIGLEGLSGRHVAKSARARADVAEDHERRCPRTPAFPHVRAVATFANGVQLVLRYDVPHLLVSFTRRQLHPKPLGLGNPLRGVFRGGRRWRSHGLPGPVSSDFKGRK